MRHCIVPYNLDGSATQTVDCQLIVVLEWPQAYGATPTTIALFPMQAYCTRSPLHRLTTQAYATWYTPLCLWYCLHRCTTLPAKFTIPDTPLHSPMVLPTCCTAHSALAVVPGTTPTVPITWAYLHNFLDLQSTGLQYSCTMQDYGTTKSMCLQDLV